MAFRLFRRDDAPDPDDRQLDRLPDLARRAHLEPVLLRRGRVDEHAIEIGAVAAGDVVEMAGGLETTRDLRPVVGPQPALVAIVGVDAHADDHVGPRLLARGVEDLHHDAQAVLDRPAEGVLAGVRRRRQELVDQIAMGKVQLDHVDADFAGAARAIAPS